MYTHPQQGSAPDEVQKLRQEAGRWLRAMRELAGLSQRDVARAVGLDYYTFVSQIESGRGRIPPLQMRNWALALNVPPRDFALHLMRFYDPLNYELIFGANHREERIAEIAKGNGISPMLAIVANDDASQSEDAKARADLEARIAKLESLIEKL